MSSSYVHSDWKKDIKFTYVYSDCIKNPIAYVYYDWKESHSNDDIVADENRFF